jgi:hypothetical protein
MRELGKIAREEAEAPLPSELARPLDAAELDAIAARVAASLDPKIGMPAPERSAQVTRLPARPRRWRWLAVAAAPVAAAAVAVLALRTPRPSGIELPPYELIVEGNQGTTRADEPAAPGDVIHVARGGRLTFVLRPRSPVTARVGARAWLDDGKALTPWNVAAKVSAEGALRIDASGGALRALPNGSSRVVLFVADAERLPEDEGAARRAIDGGAAGVQVQVVRVIVAE